LLHEVLRAHLQAGGSVDDEKAMALISTRSPLASHAYCTVQAVGRASGTAALLCGGSL
jgi:hypothetical protein